MKQRNAQQLVIFARAPVHGAVKTRLAMDIGKNAALTFYQQTLDNLLGRLCQGQWELTVATTSACEQSHPAFKGIHTVAQVNGDLGVRMVSALESFSSTDRIIIGSDIPAITTLHIQNAFDALLDNDLVFGPASDGGFWLVGCSATHTPNCQFMANVRWSTEYALADTMLTVPDDCEIATVDTLSDVDNGSSYRQFLSEASLNKLTPVTAAER